MSTYILRKGYSRLSDLADGASATYPVGAYGKVFYVDPSTTGESAGESGRMGEGIENSVPTMQEAINQCVSNRGDVIIRLRGGEAITTPILFNKMGITVVAEGFGHNPNQPEMYYTAPGADISGPTCIVSQPCSILGLEFVGWNGLNTAQSNDAGTNSAAALVFIGEGGGYTGGFSHIYKCKFVDWYSNLYGIEFAAGAYNLIEDCIFEGFDAGIVFTSTASNNPAYNIIKDSLFLTCVNGIEHYEGTPLATLVDRCHFQQITTYAIDTNGYTSTANMITDSYFEAAVTAAFDQNSAANMRGKGWNMAGNHFIDT